MSEKVCVITRSNLGHLKPLSQKSVDAFSVLVQKGRMMTGRQIAHDLNINHQNIYRSLEPLVKRGLVVESIVVRHIYAARPKVTAQNAYMRHALKEFSQLFDDAYENNARDNARSNVRTGKTVAIEKVTGMGAYSNQSISI